MPDEEDTPAAEDFGLENIPAREVYARFGLAMHYAQILEFSMVTNQFMGL
jgi:hypothetical protein